MTGIIAAAAVVFFDASGCRGQKQLGGHRAEHQPFLSTGWDADLGKVLNEFIEPANWESGMLDSGNHTVFVSGKIKGTDDTISVRVDVAEDPDNPGLASMPPKSIRGVGIDAADDGAVNVLVGMYRAYGAGMETSDGSA